MSAKILFIKEEGTNPPIEGLLSGWAQVWTNMRKLPKATPDVVICDIQLASREAFEILASLKESWHKKPVVLLFSSQGNPRDLLQKLTALSRIGRPAASRPPRVKEIARILDVSQENLARMLNVSVRTAHRWLRGARPRPKPELEQLTETVSSLERNLPDRAAIHSYLHHGNPSFGGESPMQLLLRGEFGRILGDLEAIQEGVYI
jgi:DNA-binding transcriptional regulator YiaG